MDNRITLERHSIITHRVHVSMVSLKWGDVLATLLPGVVVLFGIAPHSPWLDQQLGSPNGISVAGGLGLLMMAALAGGALEAVTRITWERWLRTCCTTNVDVLSQLSTANLELYERGVQSSYKYVTFYANFAWAIGVFVFSRFVVASQHVTWAVVLTLLMVVLLRASYMQWTYYVNYQNKVFGQGRDDAGQRSASGNAGTLHSGHRDATPNSQSVRASDAPASTPGVHNRPS